VAAELAMTRKKFATIVLLLALVAIVLFLRARPEYDIDRVDERLLALRQPYRSVVTAYYLDGGSIGIGIVDRDGCSEAFALPCDDDPRRSQFLQQYSKVFVGAAHTSHREAREIVDPEPTKRMLICILRDYPKRTPWDDYCLMQLRRHPVDFARHLLHRWKGDYGPGPGP
jgi:hypothetical protein